MLSKIKLALTVTILQFVIASSASAMTTYDLSGFPFSFSNSSSIVGTIQISTTGTYTDSTNIKNIFNNSIYSMTLSDSNGILSSINNGNSAWDLTFGNIGASAKLVIANDKMILSFLTPVEYSSGVLLAKSNDMTSVLQYRQENNVSNYNFANYSYNAMHSANSSMAYGSDFVFLATPTSVPEPTTLFLLGLGLLALLMRNTLKSRSL